MKFALSQAPGSISDVKERSRSKSRRARLEALRQQQKQEEEASFVDIMNRTKSVNYPNRLALKQRYAYSRGGSLTRSGSPTELARDDTQVIDPSLLDRSLVQRPSNVQATTVALDSSLVVRPRVNEIGQEYVAPPNLVEKEQRKADYKAMLEAQIMEKNEKKRL